LSCAVVALVAVRKQNKTIVRVWDLPY